MSEPLYLMLEDAPARPELLAPPPAVVPRLAWAGQLTALGSEPKLGKSTLVGHAVACLARGLPFLDEPLAMARLSGFRWMSHSAMWCADWRTWVLPGMSHLSPSDRRSASWRR
jgi:hypothetical protein